MIHPAIQLIHLDRPLDPTGPTYSRLSFTVKYSLDRPAKACERAISVRIALYKNTDAEGHYLGKRDNAPASLDVTWAELGELLSDLLETPCMQLPPGVAPRHPEEAEIDFLKRVGPLCLHGDSHNCPHKNRMSWSPVEIEGSRLDVNVKWITAAVIDLDRINADALFGVAERIEGLSFYLHSTHSHRPPLDCALRLVLQLSEPIHASDWPAALAYIIRDLQLPADPACKDRSRLYFLPSIYAGGPRIFYEGKGAPINVPALLPLLYDGKQNPIAPMQRVPPPPVEIPDLDAGLPSDIAINLESLRERLKQVRYRKSRGEKPEDAERYAILDRVIRGRALAQPGRRDVSINQAAAIIACALPAKTPTEAAIEVMRPAIAAMECEPEGIAYWLDKAAYSYSRAMTRRIDRDAEFERANAALRERLAGLVPKLSMRPPDLTESPQPIEHPDPEAPLEVPPETPADAMKRTLAALGIEDWQSLLIRKADGMTLQPCGENVFTILTFSDETTGTIRFNEITKTFDRSGGPFATTRFEVLDQEVTGWIARYWNLYLPRGDVADQIARCAYDNAYDPLKAYFAGLKWDGQDRLTTFLERYAGASTTNPHGADITPYVRSISRKWAISAVARALDPGCQVDTVLVLEGVTGRGKTSFFRILGGEFTLETQIDLGNKDSMQLCAQAWIIELAELVSVHRSESRQLKAFFTRIVDRFRPPYARGPVAYPRRCVFVGTTEEDDYLIDRTNRRFWPVRSGRFDLDALRLDRDQIWGQAAAEYAEFKRLKSSGCPDVENPHRWWLTEAEQEQANRETDARLRESAIDSKIHDWWFGTHPDKRDKRVTTAEVAEKVFRMTAEKIAERPGILMQIGQALRSLGFEKGREKHNGQRAAHVYIPTEALLAAPQQGKGYHLQLIASASMPAKVIPIDGSKT